MLDEDVVLKSARYANERVLILNTLALVLLPAIFDGGSSVVGFCLIFSIGLIAPVNMLTYPANWIDAPEYSRLKYFAALFPYIAFLALSCFRLEIPAVEYSPEYGGFFFLNGSQNPLAAAFIDGFAAMTDPIVLLVAAACAMSAYFVTQSRFVLRNTMILCGAAVASLTLGGWILKAVAGISTPAQTGLMAPEAFSTFSDGRVWSPFALMWASALFAVGIYTVQRFRPLSMLLSKRTAVLGMGALVFAGAAYSASPFFLPVCWLVMAFIAAVYMFNTLPSEARMAIHGKMAGEPHKKLPISKKNTSFCGLRGRLCGILRSLRGIVFKISRLPQRRRRRPACRTRGSHARGLPKAHRRKAPVRLGARLLCHGFGPYSGRRFGIRAPSGG